MGKRSRKRVDDEVSVEEALWVAAETVFEGG